MNAALGNVGKTVVFHEAPAPQEGSIAELAQALNAGEVETLVILGGNPVYNAPVELDWAKTQRKAKQVVRLGYYEDETSAVQRLEHARGSLPGVLGRRPDQRRHAGADPAADCAALRAG